MTIANPFAWGLLLLAVPIILFFLLKIRFRKEFVTTTIFWQKVFDERRNRRLRRQLRYLLSLLLALLFLSFLTAAVLDPMISAPKNNRSIIIIDNSASMNALRTDADTTRLEFAKRQARLQLDKIVAGQQIAVLSANVQPKIISGFTNHAGTLRRTLATIPATDYPADVSAALHLAEQLLADSPDAPIYVYTDSGLVSPKPNVHVIPVGQTLDNLAITRFQLRRLPELAADYEIFVEAVNFGAETVHTHLEIDYEDNIIDVLPLSLEPNVPVTRMIRKASTGGGLYRATLADTDLFPTDNVAVAFLSEQYVQRVLLYGVENFFLWNILRVLPHTEIVLIETIPDTIPPDSVLVLHQTVPLTLPSGNVLIIDPQNDGDLFQMGERLERPIAAQVDSESSLARFVQPGLVFAGAKNIIPQTNDFKTLAATADEFPLYLQFVSEDQRTLVFSADLNQGDFPLRTTFPILISQALAYFRGSEEIQKAYSTAEPVKLAVQTDKPQIILRSPSGREEVFLCQEGSISLDRLGECGVWTVFEPDSGRELTRIACNLFSMTESNLRLATEESAPSGNSAVSVLFSQTIWHYLAFLALCLTVAEWFLYQRRWIE